MQPAPPSFTQSELKAMMTYNPDTGIFVRHLPRKDKPIATDANTLYVQVRILHRCYYAHQLAWFWVHGEWPTQYIDHINQNKKDNRLCNLRVVSQSVNIQNQTHPGRRNSSGYLGVSFVKAKNRWMAAIFANGVKHFLGYFHTAEAANSAYIAAKSVKHPDCFQCLHSGESTIV